VSTTAEALEALESVEGLRADLVNAARVLTEAQAELATEQAANALEVAALQAQREAEILAHRETMRERDALREALEMVEKIGCMQRVDEEEFFCRKDDTAHSIYCPRGIARDALTTPTGEKP